MNSTDAGTSAALSTPGRPRRARLPGAGPPPAGGPIVLAPPQLWTADATAAGALLDALDLLLGAGSLTPRGLADVVAGGPVTPGGARRAADALDVGARACRSRSWRPCGRACRRRRPAVGGGAQDRRRCLRRRDLRSAAAGRGAARLGRLARPPRPRRRRGDGGRGPRRAAAPVGPGAGTADPVLARHARRAAAAHRGQRAARDDGGAAQHLQHERARVAPIPAQRIPPLGRRQVQVDAQVIRSGQFVVEAMVRSPAGRALGPPSRLQVRSTAYGTITVWLTGARAFCSSCWRRAGWCAGSGASRAVATGSGRRRGRRTPRRTARRNRHRPRTRRPRRWRAGGPTRSGTARSGTARSGTARSGSANDGAGSGAGAPDPSGAGPPGPGPTDPPGTGPPPVTAADGGGPPHRRRRRGRRGGGRASGPMAIASLVSRITGFLRQLALAACSACPRERRLHLANTLPNIVYELLLGGVLTSDIVPLLVARKRGRDRGEADTHRLLTVAGRRRSRSRPCSRWRPRRCSPGSTSATAAGRRTSSSPPCSPGCCCRRSSSTASARCSPRCSTPAACSGPPRARRCSTTSWSSPAGPLHGR